MCSILLNALCVLTIDHALTVPLWLNLLLNSLYFFITVLMCSAMAAHLFALILEHVYDSRCLRRAMALVAVLTALFGAAVLWNLRSGILFFFDGQGGYHRGPSTPWATASWRWSWPPWWSATCATAPASAGAWSTSCTPCPRWWCS